MRTVAALSLHRPVRIEGDQQTSNDADRIRATGVPAVQVNTGKGCHLEAPMVTKALEKLQLGPGGILFIENVGNLVCPAVYDLGQAFNVVALAVTEGEDKPLKYPVMFRRADLVLLTKTDLLPHLDVDTGAIDAALARVMPQPRALHLSARTGTGLEPWFDWLEQQLAARGAPDAAHPAHGHHHG